MREIVPLIGSDVTAFLGVAHLPRLWLKGILASVDALPAGYHRCSGGLDADLIEYFGLERAEFSAFTSERPTYLECERWMRANARRLDPDSIAAWNASVAERTAIADVLEDWNAVHARASKHPGVPIVPAISSATVGPLGARHLARLWLKALLKACGSLPEGWRSGPPGGMDEITYENLALDPQAAISYVETARPAYLEFEAWVGKRGKVDAATIARHNEDVIRDKPEERAASERAALGLTDPALRNNRLLNDLVDWQALRDDVAARTRATVRE